MNKPATIVGSIFLAAMLGVLAYAFLINPPPPPPAEPEPRGTLAPPSPITKPIAQAAPAAKTPGHIEVRPGSITLNGEVEIGSEFTAIVLNSGEQSRFVQKISLASGPALRLDHPENCLHEFKPGDTCQIKLRYKSQRTGADNATLLIQSAAQNDGEAPIDTLTVQVVATSNPHPPPKQDELEMAQALAQREYDREDDGGPEGAAMRAPDAPKSRQDGGVIVFGDDRNGKEKRRNRARDADYGKNFDKVVSSYPVDLSRTVLATTPVKVILDQRIVSEQCPATVRGHVGRDVFAEHGYKILLPHGTKVKGTCYPVKNGQMRVPIKWERLIRPDGAHAVLRDEDAGDQLGGPGMPGELDNRAMAALGTASAYSLVDGVIAAVSAIASGGSPTLTNVNGYPVSQQNALSAGLSAGANTLTTNTGTIVKEIVSESTKLTPVVTVDFGAAAMMTVAHDIWLKMPGEDDDGDGDADNLSLSPVREASSVEPAKKSSNNTSANSTANGTNGTTPASHETTTPKQEVPYDETSSQTTSTTQGQAGRNSRNAGGDGGTKQAQNNTNPVNRHEPSPPPDLGPAPEDVNAGQN